MARVVVGAEAQRHGPACGVGWQGSAVGLEPRVQHEAAKLSTDSQQPARGKDRPRLSSFVFRSHTVLYSTWMPTPDGSPAVRSQKLSLTGQGSRS